MLKSSKIGGKMNRAATWTAVFSIILAQPAGACVEQVLDLRREFIEWDKVTQVLVEAEGLPLAAQKESLSFVNEHLYQIEDKLVQYDKFENKSDECIVYSHSLHQDLESLMGTLQEVQVELQY